MVTKVKDRPYFFVIITRLLKDNLKCLVNKQWRTTYTQYKLHVEKKWRLGEVNIFENCCIMEMRLRKWSGFMCK